LETSDSGGIENMLFLIAWLISTNFKMVTLSDNEVIREAIELFLVQYFNNLDMAGTVQQEKRDNLNYFSIDLNELDWDNNLDKLHTSLNKYITDWAKINAANFQDYSSVATLTIEYLLPEKEDSIQNQSKMIRLFYLPAFYFRIARNEARKRHPIIIWILRIWYNVIQRNIIIVIIPTLFFLTLTFYKIKQDYCFVERLAKSFEYVNVASSIIASFLLGYLINKVLNIRQDKLKRTDEIKNLSNQLTYFRNICFNLLGDHNYWNVNRAYKSSFEYANSIKTVITYEEFYYPNYHDDKAYAKYRSVQNADISHPIVLLILQLYMMSGDEFLHSNLTYTEYPANHVYSFKQMEKFSLFTDANQIWYCCTNNNYFPDIFPDTYGTSKMREDMSRIDPQYKAEHLTKKALEKLSLDFQYKIIPLLYQLTRYAEAGLPFTIKYFQTVFTLILTFGIIIPCLLYVFISQPIYAFINVFSVIAIIGHILLSLRAILNTENTLDQDEDYF
jgi:hypothetical protein